MSFQDAVETLAAPPQWRRALLYARVGFAAYSNEPRFRTIQRRVLPESERPTCVTIRNEMSELAVLSDALRQFCVQHAVGRRTGVQLHVTLDEIVSNIIKYAWPEGGAHELSVCMSAEADTIRVEVVDDGKAFDPRTAPPPPATVARRRVRPGGIGIHLVRQLVDEIAYHRGDGRNHVVVTMRRDASRQPRKA
jgi:serine/threonine-protein kinase RsbW